MQSTTRSMPVRSAIRLNPQSAMRNMQNCFKRSELELLGPKSGLKIRPRLSRRVRSAPLLAQIPNPPTERLNEG
eukprot:11048231-Alexandrium_andersonii.AAC.1